MDIDRYLERIGLSREGVASGATGLYELQRRHLLSIPFENLDIHWGRRIVLKTGLFYSKVVDERRGGFCYELNGLFNELLRDLGYKTRLVSACVADGKGGFTPEYDHAAIIAIVSNTEYLVDVGFGAFTAEPLVLELDREQTDRTGVFIIRKLDHEYFEVAKMDGGAWRSEYKFSRTARELAEFAERCDYQQDSPDSHFRKGKLCSIMTDVGRKTLTDRSLIETNGAERIETAVADDEQFHNMLRAEFAIEKAKSFYA